MAQFHAVFLSEAAASCAFTHTSTSINNSNPFQTQDLHHRKQTTIWNLKLSLSLQLYPRVGVSQWSTPGGTLWWQHSCQRHWPCQVLLVTSVCLSALSVALVNNIQLSPHLCSSPGQEMRDTGSICPRLSVPSLPRTVSRGDQSLRKVCPWLQGLFAGSCFWNCQQGCHVWRWLQHPAARTGTRGAQVGLGLINNSLQADNSRPCFSSIWISQLQGTDAWRFVHCFSNTPNMHSALLTPPCFSSDCVTHGYS